MGAVVPTRALALTFTQAQYRDMVWVLTVQWAVRLRWASTAVEIEDEGVRTMARGGLEVDYTERVYWFGDSDSAPEVAVSGLRPPAGIDVATTVLDGHPLTGAPAELAQWVPGTLWVQRKVVLVGEVLDARFGGRNEPLSFVVRPRRRQDLPRQPGPSEEINASTWPFPTRPTLGDAYPIVYGKPGRRDLAEFDIDLGAAFGTGTGAVRETGRAGGSPIAIALYEGEVTVDGTPQGVLSGLPPDEGQEPSRVLGIAMLGHTALASSRAYFLIRAYKVFAVGGGTAPAAGDMTIDGNGTLALIQNISLFYFDLDGASLRYYTMAAFVGGRIRLQWAGGGTAEQPRRVVHKILAAVDTGASWDLALEFERVVEDGTTAAGDDFQVELELVPQEETIRVINTSKQNTPSTVALIASTDALGQPVTLVELTGPFRDSDPDFEVLGGYTADGGSARDPYLLGDELWCLWRESEGALAADRRAGPLRSAGEIIEYALRRGSADVDTAAWQAISEELNTYLVDTYRNNPKNAWEWVNQELLPLLPVGIVHTGSGLAPVLWRWDATARDSAMHLVAGQRGLERRGQPKESADWSNSIRVHYTPKTSGGDFLGLTAVTGQPVVSAVQKPSAGTRASVAARGLREARALRTAAVFDAYTAERIAAWQAARFASPAVTVDLRDRRLSTAHVPLGAVIEYTDAEIGWTRELGVVTQRRWTNESAELRVLFVPDPVRGFGV